MFHSFLYPQCGLQVCPPLQHYGWSQHPIHLGLSGEVQQTNASLALQLAHAWLSKQGQTLQEMGGVVDVLVFYMKAGVIQVLTWNRFIA